MAQALMDKLTVLIAIVIVGLAVCWRSLRRIENYLYQCLSRLSDLSSAADDVKGSTEQSSTTLENVREHLEQRFPLPEGYDDPYPPLPKP